MDTDVNAAKRAMHEGFFVPRLFVVFPTGVTLLLACVAWVAPLTDTQRLQSLWTLIGITLGLLLTILYRHFEVFRSLAETKKSLDASIAANNESILLHHRMAKLEASLKSDDQFGKLCSINDALGTIASTRLKLTTFSDLIRWKEERVFSYWHAELARLSDGQIDIDDAHKELNTNEILLCSIPTRTVRAVSFEDEEFWRSPEGQSFLKAHRLLASKGVKIARIFIVDGDPSKYQVTFAEQVAHGIEVRYLPRSAVREIAPEDFVIYDDVAVRVGYKPVTVSTSENKLINKYARITVRRPEVDQYAETFEFLLKRSFPAIAPAKREG